MGIDEILDLVVIIAWIVYTVREHKLTKRLIKICYGLIEQNQKLEEQNELLRTIFSKQYEEVKKKYGLKSEAKE
jgi:hypothetical protein